MAQIIVVLEFPPSAFYKILVNAESLYGTARFLFFPPESSANIYMTLPSVCKDLLIKLASFILSLLSPTPVFDTL